MQQCMELTNTNRSRAYPKFLNDQIRFRIQFSGIKHLNSYLFSSDVSDFEKHSCKITFGGDSGGVPHVPIPNTTVKPSSADGTWTAGSWESRTSPSTRKKNHC